MISQTFPKLPGCIVKTSVLQWIDLAIPFDICTPPVDQGHRWDEIYLA